MNNNQWEALIKLIIPAILVIFWAINQIFQKDLTAPRTAKRPPPRDPFEAPTAPANRPPAPVSPRPSRPPTPARPRPMRPEDEIVILSSEEKRPRPAAQQDARTARAQGPASGRNRQANRQGPGTSRTPEAARARSQGAGRGLNDLIGDPTHMIGPLSEVRGMEQVHLENTQGGAMRRAARTTAPAVTEATSLKSIQDALKSPERIREAFIISELLQPPVVMRRAPRNRI